MSRQTGISASFTDSNTVDDNTLLTIVELSPVVEAAAMAFWGEGWGQEDTVFSGSYYGSNVWSPGNGILLYGYNLGYILDCNLIPRGPNTAAPLVGAQGDSFQIGGVVWAPDESNQLPDTYMLLLNALAGYVNYSPDDWYEIEVLSRESGWQKTGIILGGGGTGLNFYAGAGIFEINQETLYPGIAFDFTGINLNEVASINISGSQGVINTAFTMYGPDMGHIAAWPNLTGEVTMTPVRFVSGTVTPWYGTAYNDTTPQYWNGVTVWQQGDLPDPPILTSGTLGPQWQYPGHNYLSFGSVYGRNAYFVNFDGPMGLTTTFQGSAVMAASYDTGNTGSFASLNRAENLVLGVGASIPTSLDMVFTYSNDRMSAAGVVLPKIYTIERNPAPPYGTFETYDEFSLKITGENLHVFGRPPGDANYIYIRIPFGAYNYYAYVTSVTPTLINAAWGRLWGGGPLFTPRDTTMTIITYARDLNYTNYPFIRPLADRAQFDEVLNITCGIRVTAYSNPSRVFFSTPR